MYLSKISHSWDAQCTYYSRSPSLLFLHASEPPPDTGARPIPTNRAAHVKSQIKRKREDATIALVNWKKIFFLKNIPICSIALNNALFKVSFDVYKN